MTKSNGKKGNGSKPTNGDKPEEALEKSYLSELDERERAFIEILTGIEVVTNIGEAGEQAGYHPKYAYQVIQRPRIQQALEKLREAKWAKWRLHEEAIMTAIVKDAIKPPLKHGKDFSTADNDAAFKNRQLYLQAIGRVATGGHQFNLTNIQGHDEARESRSERISRHLFPLAD